MIHFEVQFDAQQIEVLLYVVLYWLHRMRRIKKARGGR